RQLSGECAGAIASHRSPGRRQETTAARGNGPALHLALRLGAARRGHARSGVTYDRNGQALLRSERQPISWLTEERRHDLHHQIVILALRQAGHGDGANDAGALGMDGKAPAMGRIVHWRDAALLVESVVFGGEFAPE